MFAKIVFSKILSFCLSQVGKQFVGYKGIWLILTNEIMWRRDFQRIICRKSIRYNIFVKYYEK